MRDFSFFFLFLSAGNLLGTAMRLQRSVALDYYFRRSISDTRFVRLRIYANLWEFKNEHPESSVLEIFC